MPTWSNLTAREYMSIRPAKQQDATAISQLIAALSHYYTENGTGVPPDWFTESITPRLIRNKICSEEYVNYVYVHDKAVVGYIAIKDHHHVYHLFVASEYQGKGIARQLWETVRTLSQSRHFIVRSSLYAVPIYERFGFRPSGPVDSKDGIAYQAMEFEV